MTAFVKPLVVAAVGLGCVSGAVLLTRSEPQPPVVVPIETADDTVAGATELIDAPGAGTAAEKPAVVELIYAVEPKPLSEPVKKGLAFLVANQQADGGWNQGGGWRTDAKGQGGRVEGKEVEDPSDVGNSCVALLALVRAGNTPAVGEYKDHVKKGLTFVFDRVEKADATTLYVTDVRNTQLQSKIGPYVDTFLANLLLAELKGKAGEQEKRLAKCLDKTIDKIAKNQQGNGQFAGNGGWAPVLSQSLANKGLSRAKLNGADVSNTVLANAVGQSQFAANSPAFASASGVRTGAIAGEVGGGGIGGGGIGGGGGGPAGASGIIAMSSPADAGVALYRISQGAGNSQDGINSLKGDADRAKVILANPKSHSMSKGIAKMRLDRLAIFTRENVKAQAMLRGQVQNESFVAGFGSNGGEEFLSFLNISEALLVAGGPDWEKWDKRMQDGLTRTQDKNGNWSGQHCITGKTFCTAGALLVLTADRTQFPAAVIEQAKKDAAAAKAAEDKKDGKIDEPKK